MAVRNIRVIGDRMEPRRIYAGTRGSYITEVAFTFSGEWDGLTKKLIFYPVRGKPVYINYTYGSEKIPYEVMRYSGDAIMLMSGYSVETDGSLGDKIVTASAFVAVDPAESDTQNEPDIPEATEFEKIVAKLGAPYIGENGNWFVWDVYTHEFVDTGLPARGEQGETGRGLTILGKYGSLDDLRASVKDAQPGDAYAVGEKAPYTIYIWDDVSGDFTNHGDLRGVGITKIEQITDNTGSGEPNTIRIVTDDGAEYDYTVYNGERGHPGNIWIGETEPPDDSYTIWLNPGGAVSGFLESHQGTENAGRVLVVGDDGIVRPGEYAGGGGGTITEESDPTVPDWAKQPNKPKYTAAEVGALSESALDSAIDSALAEAKESGEFDGGRGAMILNVTSWPLVYTTETNSLIKYRSPISTVLAQSGASDVKAGDIVWCGTYHYSVLSTDDTYAYMGAYTFIQGATGKSAYSYAQDGGYTGTEEDFAKKLAQDVPEGGGSGGDYGSEVNTGRILAQVTFTEETTGFTVTDLSADVTELTIVFKSTTHVTAPKFSINNHKLTMYIGTWRGQCYVFVRIDKKAGKLMVKSRGSNNGVNVMETNWGDNEIVESIGIDSLGFAANDYFNVYEGLTALLLKEHYIWLP